jgi:hypothetical protein
LKNIFYALFCYLLFCACSNDKNIEHINAQESISKIKTLAYTTNSNKSSDQIVLKVLSIDTVMHQKSWSLMIDLNIILKNALTNPNEAYMIDVNHTNDKTKFIYSKYLYNKYTYNTIHPDYDIFCIKNLDRNLKLYIPLNELQLNSGSQDLNLKLYVQKVYLEKDPNSSILKYQLYDDTELCSQIVSTTIHLPKLNYKTLALSDIRVEMTKETKKFDFTLNNQGLPDLYWQVWVGNSLKYFSPTFKNSLTLEKEITSDTLYFYPNDLISIYVLDFDNGPFNQDDLIINWIGNEKSLLKLKSLNNDLLKSCKVEIK